MRHERHRGSRWAARFAAPAAFLAAITIAVLLVRSGLSGDGDTAPTATTKPEPRATTTAPRAATTKEAVTLPGPTSPGAREVYTIAAGDTLETIAAQFDTSVEQLLTLNPDLDPVALRIGQQIRVE